MFIHSLSPVLFRIGSIEIRYYSLAFIVSLLIGIWLFNYFSRVKKLPLTKEDVLELAIMVFVGIIIGARTFYMFVYDPTFFDNPLRIIYIWKGGLSGHGAILGALLAGIIFARRKKIHIMHLVDNITVPAAIAQALIRMGNFFNGELVGRITNVPWAMNFGNEIDLNGLLIYRHPYQLYGIVKNLLIAALCLYLFKKKSLPARGVIGFSYILMYGAFRFFTEFFRQPDPQLGFVIAWLSMGQILSLGMITIGGIGLFTILRKSR